MWIQIRVPLIVPSWFNSPGCIGDFQAEREPNGIAWGVFLLSFMHLLTEIKALEGVRRLRHTHFYLSVPKT